MYNEIKIPEIFFSYCWLNKEECETIDEHFQRIGIPLLRDNRNVSLGENIEEYMLKISSSEFALLLISHEYLKSKNCMLEAIEFVNSKDFEKRCLPVILKMPTSFFKNKDRKVYYEYWKEQLELTQNLLNNADNRDHQKEHSKIKKIYDELDDFFLKITPIVFEPYDDLVEKNFNPILLKTGFSEAEVIKRVLLIERIQNLDTQEVALDGLLKRFPKNEHALFLKAILSEKKGNIQYAIFFYRKILKDNPKAHGALNNLALLMQDYFKNYTETETLLKKAIEAKPEEAEFYNNLGELIEIRRGSLPEARDYYLQALDKNPSHGKALLNLALYYQKIEHNYQLSREYFEKAYELNKSDAKVLYHFAYLLCDHFKDYTNALICLNNVISIDPTRASAYNKLGLILRNNLKKYDEARMCFKQSIVVGPSYYASYVNLANLLCTIYEDYEGAKYNYEEAIRINPDISEAYLGLGNLYLNAYGDYSKTEECYKKGLEVNRNDPLLQYNCFVLYWKFINNEIKAIEHYTNAVALDPTLSNQEMNTFLGIS